MTIRAKATVIFTSLALTLSSCSVKEDRDGCPCLLTVDTEQTVEGSTLLNIVHTSQGAVAQEELPAGTKSFSTEVPRGTVCVYAFGNSDGWEMSEDGLYVYPPEGNEPGRIYAHSDIVNCNREQAWDELVMHKQWCTISMMLEDPALWEGCEFAMESSWNGFYLSDFSAVPGNTNCPVRRISDDFLEVRVTRQGDDGLVLRVSPDGDSIAVGQVIAEAGYDWSKTALDDIILCLSESSTAVNVEIVEWEDGINDPNIEI